MATLLAGIAVEDLIEYLATYKVSKEVLDTLSEHA